MSLINENLKDFLIKNSINFTESFEISKKSWIKSGGIIDIFIKPKNTNEIKNVLNFLKKNNVNYCVIGNLSNTIIRDGLIITPFINLGLIKKIKILKNEKGLHFYADSGVPIPVLSKFVSNKGYTGTEGLFGIPGSLGGGIFMNASSYGEELTKYLHKVVSIDQDNNIFVTKKEDANFSWRYSDFQKNNRLILGAYFFFSKDLKREKILLDKKLKKYAKTRKDTQEKSYPNLGSLFATKNIYSELKFVSISLFILFIMNKLINFIFFRKIFNKYLFRMRVLINSLYLKNLNLNNDPDFSFSYKTINCLINKGSVKSTGGINLIRRFQKKTNNKIKLENIILDKIL